jgi:hypothetical protein
MKVLHYILDGRKVIIRYRAEDPVKYYVWWDKVEIGYLYISRYDVEIGDHIWVGSSDLINLYIGELSTYIQTCNQ